MTQCTFAPSARADLLELFRHIAGEAKDPDIAERFLDKIEQRCDLLAHFPHSGMSCGEPGKRENRRVPFENYVIYYRPLQNGVYITRIVNARMDQNRIKNT